MIIGSSEKVKNVEKYVWIDSRIHDDDANQTCKFIRLNLEKKFKLGKLQFLKKYMLLFLNTELLLQKTI